MPLSVLARMPPSPPSVKSFLIADHVLQELSGKSSLIGVFSAHPRRAVPCPDAVDRPLRHPLERIWVVQGEGGVLRRHGTCRGGEGLEVSIRSRLDEVHLGFRTQKLTISAPGKSFFEALLRRCPCSVRYSSDGGMEGQPGMSVRIDSRIDEVMVIPSQPDVRGDVPIATWVGRLIPRRATRRRARRPRAAAGMDPTIAGLRRIDTSCKGPEDRSRDARYDGNRFSPHEMLQTLGWLGQVRDDVVVLLTRREHSTCPRSIPRGRCCSRMPLRHPVMAGGLATPPESPGARRSP